MTKLTNSLHSWIDFPIITKDKGEILQIRYKEIYVGLGDHCYFIENDEKQHFSIDEIRMSPHVELYSKDLAKWILAINCTKIEGL
jgi:hypothetical protein